MGKLSSIQQLAHGGPAGTGWDWHMASPLPRAVDRAAVDLRLRLRLRLTSYTVCSTYQLF